MTSTLSNYLGSYGNDGIFGVNINTGSTSQMAGTDLLQMTPPYEYWNAQCS